MRLYCFCCLPSSGPIRHSFFALLLVLSAAAIYICFQKYETPEDSTPSRNANACSLTAQILLIVIMILSGLAVVLFLIIAVVAKHEDFLRQRQVQEHEKYEYERNWLQKFLDPHYLNTPTYIEDRNNYFESLVHDSPVWKWGFYAPSVALSVVLVIRLFVGTPVFLGDPSALDFGWKYGIVDNDDAEKNASFTVELNSYGHGIQGFFASLLATPLVIRWLLHLLRGRLKSLLQLTPFALTIYPTYNLIKRFVKSREAFAGSSFANNGFEWVAGFALGLAVDQLITAVASFIFVFCGRKLRPCISEDVEQGQSVTNYETASDPEYHPFQTTCVVATLQKVFGLFLVFTLYAAAVLYGITWYSCLEDSECVNAEYGFETVGEEISMSAQILIIMTVASSTIMLLGVVV